MKYLNDIPVGRENAVSRRELARRWGVSDRHVRRIVMCLRQAEGAGPILSDGGGMGYYRSNDSAEAREYLRREYARAANTLRPLRQALNAAGWGAGTCRLRALREARGLSQKDMVNRFAECALPIDRVALSKCECGHVMLPPRALQAAARILDVSPADIYPALLIDVSGLWEGC